MSEQLTKLRSRLYIFLVIEVGISILLYFLFQELSFLIFSGIMILNSAVIGVGVMHLFNHIHEEAMTVSKAVGSDAKNAFLFGFIGLVMYDENHCITWMSELFNELGISKIGVKLEDWDPRFRLALEEEQIVRIRLENRIYEVYNNPDSRMLYLKDVTNYAELMEQFEVQRPIMMYLSVDNFDEVVNNVDEQKGALLQSTIRTTLAAWAREYQIILKRYRQENYVAFLNEEIYRQLTESKFVILNRIREQAQQLGEVMSLSIGISKTTGSLKEMDEDAADALNLAFSRGGDQVVVKTQGEPIRFFGGNLETYAKSNKVKVRVIANSLNGLFKPASHVFVMGHQISDLDSFGASIGMWKIAKNSKKEAYIVVDQQSMEDKTLRAYHEISKENDCLITPEQALEIVDKESLLICVDNHKPSLAISKELINEVTNIVVIDHHRRGEEFINRPTLTYLEPAASSTVELISELFEYQDRSIRLTELEATIMYAGILVDTMDFKTRTGVRTFRVAALLKDMGANVSRAVEMLQDDYVFTLKKAQLVQNAIRYNERVLISAGEDQTTYSRVMLAKVGNELLEINETQASFVIGRVDESTVAISSRSNGKINVQVIMEKMGGGGHFSMAACQLKDCSVNDAKRLLVEKLDEYYSEREE